MRVLLALFLLTTSSGCQLFGDTYDDPIRTFDYTARDSDGAVVAEGTLMLTFSSAADDASCRPSCNLYTISGRRSIEANEESVHRLFSESASVDGLVRADSTLHLSLFPPIPDLGFELTGRFDDEVRGSFSGTWAPCGFGGCLPAGTFTATR